MLQSTSKPLPDIPADSTLHRLTVESNALIHTLIQRHIDHEGLDVSWIAIIKSALADLGERVVSGQWLPGLRSTRKAQNYARILEEKAIGERARKERERLNELKLGKNKGSDKLEIKAVDIKAIQSKEERSNLALKELHALTSKPSVPTPTLSPRHLFLTTSFQPAELADRDSEFDFILESRHCTFLPDVYSFPVFEDEQGAQGDGGLVVCGLDSWSLDREVKPLVVGGNFLFHHLDSATVHESLTAVLRLSIYTYLSLILEQDLLANSRISLQYPPRLSPVIPVITPQDTPVPESPTFSPSKRKARVSKASSGIWSFLSKKTEHIFHRSPQEAKEPSPYASSLDLGTASSSSRPLSDAVDTGSTTNTIKGSAGEDEDRWLGPFTSAVRVIQDSRCILSTSPGVEFPLPPLLLHLATQEQNRLASASEPSSLASSTVDSKSSGTPTVVTTPAPSPGLRLTAAEKAGLGSILGWEGREARGKGMADLRGFVRHQGLTVLYAEHTSPDVPCGRPRWVTFRYWARRRTDDAEADRTLGETMERACETAKETCCIEDCGRAREQHRMTWTCAGVRINGAVKEAGAEFGDGEDLSMWESCTICGHSAERVRMDDGTYLFSFAKFLELLLWSSLLAWPSLCDHTAGPPTESRFNVQHHFAYKGRVLTLSLTAIQKDMFEIRVPKLQVMSGSIPKEEKRLEETRKRQQAEQERQILSAEINEWWSGFRKKVDRLDVFLRTEVEASLEGKDLPPLPMSDDDDLNDEIARSWLPEQIHTPSPQRPRVERSVSYPTTVSTSQTVSRPNTPRPKSSKPAAPYPPGSSISINQSRHLLEQMRSSFQSTEDTMRKHIAEDPQMSSNDIRCIFRSTARGAAKRLVAWQKKHAPGMPAETVSNFEPEWWQATCHAVPGGRVVVREGEWGSVIAYTLSSTDYLHELASVSSAVPSQPSPPSTVSHSEPATPFPVTTMRIFKSASSIPDPDDMETTSFLEEPEPCTAVISRREHPREVSALLSLRDVLRNKKSFDASSLGSRFSGSVSRGLVPPSAWAQPQVQVNFQPADGQVSQFPEAAEVVERVLVSQYPGYRQVETTSSSEDMATPTPSTFVERNIRSGKTESIISVIRLEHEQDERPVSDASSPTSLTTPSSSSPTERSSDTSSVTSASSLSGAFTSAMRYFLHTGSPPSSRPSSPTPPPPHHGLLALETVPIDDRPHIKYDWTIGKRLKFSCTVYYAKQFDALRKRCGVGDIMLKSLERTENWTAVGGKSKSNFWKSSDDRFIIKTLVNAWNVTDLQVLIDLGPSYFRYIDSTASKPSVLAKLMGFYTVEIKNLETGTMQSKADLLVMENLFYNQKVSKTFDLKGIQSRRVKPNGDAEQRTLFDGEWIDAQQRLPLLIQPHSKLILHEAIKSDAEFLARSNIMDYSLLLGIDQDRHEIACGLVDTIGSYTFAKTLEYKAKQNLNSGKGKEVTVIPPAEYQHRFVNAIEGYFLACPDKWTKPSSHIDRSEPYDLASVL